MQATQYNYLWFCLIYLQEPHASFILDRSGHSSRDSVFLVLLFFPGSQFFKIFDL